jgi:hypothetical protein
LGFAEISVGARFAQSVKMPKARSPANSSSAKSIRLALRSPHRALNTTLKTNV